MTAYEVSLQTVQRVGRDLGFDEVGVTGIERFDELIPTLEAYAARGTTGFEEQDISLRVNPQMWMPGVQSLVVVALSYLTHEGYEMAHRHAASRSQGKVTVYSYGEDYHQVITDRLQQLHRSLEVEVGRSFRAIPLVDTGPGVDRRIAERAGIGWIGKNSMLYTDDHGSFVFVGTLAVDIRIEPSRDQQPSRCGSCTQCMTACPTGALIAPGEIDATRCLSYITQMKGMIPKAFRKPLGRRVWGCDTCQWSCPENKDKMFSKHPEFLPQRDLAYPELLDVLNLSNQAFKRLYGRSAAAWRGLATWKRNAIIALGNTRNIEAVPHITPFLSHARPELRASAAWALSQIAPKETQAIVADAFHREHEPQVKEEMAWAVDAEQLTLKEECQHGSSH